MYLKVQYNNSIKPYTLTDNYNKPYIKVSNSILPLTTNTTQGLHLIVSTNNTTYRPLEYQSMSTSNTYYTSGINSIGLSSTTALTRSSTSQTVYHTCSSTSGTSYLTRSSTSGTSYLTVNTTANMSFSGTHYYYSLANTSKYDFKVIGVTNTFSSSTRKNNDYWFYTNITTTVAASMTTRKSTRNGTQTFEMTQFPAYNINNGSTTYTTYNITNNRTYSYSITQSKQEGSNGEVTWYNSRRFLYTTAQAYLNSYSDYIVGNTKTARISTTGTSYLTCSSTSGTSYLTRSSTSATSYLTRSSTSGYSGVSSSSSESSGWL